MLSGIIIFDYDFELGHLVLNAGKRGKALSAVLAPAKGGIAQSGRRFVPIQSLLVVPFLLLPAVQARLPVVAL